MLFVKKLPKKNKKVKRASYKDAVINILNEQPANGIINISIRQAKALIAAIKLRIRKELRWDRNASASYLKEKLEKFKGRYTKALILRKENPNIQVTYPYSLHQDFKEALAA